MKEESILQKKDVKTSYIWDEKAQEKGEDKPVKQNDHALDALRYLLQTLFPNKKRGAYFVK